MMVQLQKLSYKDGTYTAEGTILTIMAGSQSLKY